MRFQSAMADEAQAPEAIFPAGLWIPGSRKGAPRNDGKAGARLSRRLFGLKNLAISSAWRGLR
jgi:hypothetical protein